MNPLCRMFRANEIAVPVPDTENAAQYPVPYAGNNCIVVCLGQISGCCLHSNRIVALELVSMVLTIDTLLAWIFSGFGSPYNISQPSFSDKDLRDE